MILPKKIEKGDHIGILSTARSVDNESITRAVEWLHKLGLEAVCGETLSLTHHQFAGTDTERIADFQKMIADPKIKAIWCARGGYGTARLLDNIDFSPLLQTPKWILGYSDITALHCHLHRLGIASVHCTMPINLSQNTPEALSSLENFFFGRQNQYQWQNDISYDFCQIQGEIIGGNLSVIYSLLGSKSAISTEGKILFLEDLDEYLYHIDRMMLNLKRNGLLSNLKALVVGSFTQMHDNATPFGFSVKEIISEHCQNADFPIIFNAPAGHIDDNRTLIFGKTATLVLDGKSITLSV